MSWNRWQKAAAGGSSIRTRMFQFQSKQGCQNVLNLPYFTKESEEYPSRVAGQKQEVSGDLCWLPATFDNPEKVQKID